jgi:hypothetical protein
LICAASGHNRLAALAANAEALFPVAITKMFLQFAHDWKEAIDQVKTESKSAPNIKRTRDTAARDCTIACSCMLRSAVTRQFWSLIPMALLALPIDGHDFRDCYYLRV